MLLLMIRSTGILIFKRSSSQIPRVDTEFNGSVTYMVANNTFHR